MPFASTSLGAEQPLLNSEPLGYGHDPLAPIKDAVTADGDVVVPLDAAGFGLWLKAAFGAPTTTGADPWTHEFLAGHWTLPSMSIETGMSACPPVVEFCRAEQAQAAAEVAALRSVQWWPPRSPTTQCAGSRRGGAGNRQKWLRKCA